MISAILSDPINTYFSDFKYGIVDRINGTKINTLDDMANELRKPAEQYVIDLLHEGRPIVLESSAVAAARERIRQRYNVEKDQNLRE